MQWEVYRKTYYTYLLSVSQTSLLTRVASEVLKDFPRKLPDNLYRTLKEDLRKAVDAFRRLFSVSRPGEESPTITFQTEGDIFQPTFDMYSAQAMLGHRIQPQDFMRTLCSQELVMLFAHLDAFIADSVRAICQVRPEVLKRDKTIEWKIIFDCGGWEHLVNHLIERYVYEFGWGTVRKRIGFVTKEFGLEVEMSEASLRLIDEAENTRNIVVHNGGRVSQEYIARTGRTDVTLGELVPLPLEYVERAAIETRMLASVVMECVARKFFNIKDADLPVRYGDHESDDRRKAP